MRGARDFGVFSKCEWTLKATSLASSVVPSTTLKNAWVDDLVNRWSIRIGQNCKTFVVYSMCETADSVVRFSRVRDQVPLPGTP